MQNFTVYRTDLRGLCIRGRQAIQARSPQEAAAAAELGSVRIQDEQCLIYQGASDFLQVAPDSPGEALNALTMAEQFGKNARDLGASLLSDHYFQRFLDAALLTFPLAERSTFKASMYQHWQRGHEQGN